MFFLTKESDICFDDVCVFYFYTSWIPFHKKMIIMLDKMEQKYNNMKFYAINGDEHKNICRRFVVDHVPTIIIFDKQELKRIEGLVLTSALKNAFADIYSKNT
jgi:thioredoxin-like negative regulator of GroEL